MTSLPGSRATDLPRAAALRTSRSSCELSLGCPSGPERAAGVESFSPAGDRMNIHKNALPDAARSRRCGRSRAGRRRRPPPRAASVCPRTARKWWTRFRPKVWRVARPSRPHRLDRPTPAPTAAQISLAASVEPAGRSPPKPASPRRPSVASLKRLGLNGISGARADRATRAPLRAQKPERTDPSLDISRSDPVSRRSAIALPATATGHEQRLAALAGSSFAVCIDVMLRRVTPSASFCPTRKKACAVAFLKAAESPHYASLLGVLVSAATHDRQRLVLSKSSALPARHATGDLAQGIHQELKPFHAQNGIRNQAGALRPDGAREWACHAGYPHSDRCAAELPIWLHRYNWHRPAQRDKIKAANQPPSVHRGSC